MAKKYDWEVPEIDLNLRHYDGRPSDVIKKIKNEIEAYLMNDSVSEKNRKIYSAVFNALDYYKTISYLPSAEYQTGETFLSYSIQELNNNYRQLSKYNKDYPDDKPVVKMDARIKSPLSFVEKTKRKIDEYLREGRDLSYLNESLRDLIGARITITPPKEIKERGEQAKVDFLYKVYLDFMRAHGIEEDYQESLKNGQYRFISVNTKHNPNKLKQMQEQFKKEGLPENVLEKIHIPEKRPIGMENPLVNSVTKDYIKYPKASGYQALHTCVEPYYSSFIEHSDLPTFIIPPSTYSFSIEYHFQTDEQHHEATYGISAHDKYKPDEMMYHRLAVPSYIDFDDPEIMEEDSLPSNKNEKSLHKDELRLRNFAESLKKLYKISFYDMFGISFKNFRDKFSTSARNDILALRKRVKYDKEKNTYYTVEVAQPCPLTAISQEYLRNAINTDSKKATWILEQCGVLDSTIIVDEDGNSTEVKPNPPKVYTVETSNEKTIQDEFPNISLDVDSSNNAEIGDNQNRNLEGKQNQQDDSSKEIEEL